MQNSTLQTNPAVPNIGWILASGSERLNTAIIPIHSPIERSLHSQRSQQGKAFFSSSQTSFTAWYVRKSPASNEYFSFALGTYGHYSHQHKTRRISMNESLPILSFSKLAIVYHDKTFPKPQISVSLVYTDGGQAWLLTWIKCKFPWNKNLVVFCWNIKAKQASLC